MTVALVIVPQHVYLVRSNSLMRFPAVVFYNTSSVGEGDTCL